MTPDEILAPYLADLAEVPFTDDVERRAFAIELRSETLRRLRDRLACDYCDAFVAKIDGTIGDDADDDTPPPIVEAPDPPPAIAGETPPVTF